MSVGDVIISLLLLCLGLCGAGMYATRSGRPPGSL
jgi:hypothetical protein